MDTKDFAFIEYHLGVRLPRVFQEFARQFPNNTVSAIQADCVVLPANAELFVIGQLCQFRDDSAIDYYELQPDLSDHRFVNIGDDGSGNFYCMAGNNADSNDLWLWEHDPYNGFRLIHDMHLSDYFGPHWEITTFDNPFAHIPDNGRIISRADHPHRSILKPISLEEWYRYIKDDRILDLDEFHEYVNPFTQEKINARKWPGRAKLTIDGLSARISYLHGYLTLSSDSDLEGAHMLKFRQIAGDLKANLF